MTTLHTNKRTACRQFVGGLFALLSCLLLVAGTARAANTTAGTAITNSAIVSYEVGSIPQPTTTAAVTFVVDRMVNLVVTKNADATVAPGSVNQSLVFLVSNTSNTALRFSLSPVSKVSNTWNMGNVRIYRDDNNNGAWNAGDTLYADASTFGDIASGASVSVLVVADTPGSLSTGQSAAYDLLATAVDSGATTTVFASAAVTAKSLSRGIAKSSGSGNLMAVLTVFGDAAGSAAGDAVRDGRHSAAGTYSATIPPLAVNMNKSVAVSDQWGGTQPIPGATLSYTITVTTSGSGNANNVVITDPLPLNTVYIPGTLKLNGNPLSDAADLDAGDVGATTAGTVTVKLGNLTSASPVQRIRFDVRIQ